MWPVADYRERERVGGGGVGGREFGHTAFMLCLDNCSCPIQNQINDKKCLFLVSRVCMLRARVVVSGYSGFLPQSKHMRVSLTGDCKLVVL